jgi:Uma2 family endonuclease
MISPTIRRQASNQRFHPSNVDWGTYTRLLRALENRRLRLTYDQGELEILSPSPEHESGAWFVSRLVVVLTEEFGLPIKGAKSTTLKRKRRHRGLEPDDCFWIANEPRMRGKKRLNLAKDPPPDLAIESDVTRSYLDRMGIYSALHVNVLWRLEDNKIQFYGLTDRQRYQRLSGSRIFAQVAAKDLQHFIDLAQTHEENEVIRQFRDWVRKMRRE